MALLSSSRVVLSTLVVSAVVTALSSCGSDDEKQGNKGGSDGGVEAGVDSGPDKTPEPEAGTEAGVALDAFGAWVEIRAALRRSPDQRLARADAVVESRNAETIYRFVTDEIATYPSSDAGFEEAATAKRWGTRGTLRGGAGTPREKAELLQALYERAGFDAELVVGTATFDGKQALLRDFSPRYAPDFSVAKTAEWRVALGHDAVTSRPVIDQGGSSTRALSASLLAQLPESLTSPFDFTVRQIPLVRVKVNGADRYANPLVPLTKFGDSLTEETELDVAPDAAPPPPITVRLEAVRANAPFERFTLVEGEFATEDVAGRKLHLAFVPPVSAANLSTTRIDSVSTFVPLLSVAGSDTTLAERDRLAKIGNPVSLGGDVYTLNDEGDVTINGTPLPAASEDSDAADSVVDLTATVDPATFPEITVRIRATDTAGKGVPHLPASALGLEEEDAAVSFSIVQNEAPPPRVALLFDTSTSIPDAFRGASAVALGKNIVASLYAKYPAAEVRAGTVYFGVNWFGDAWATSAADANTQIEAVATAPGGSEIWDALAKAAAEKPTIVVIITDGNPSEPVTPGNRIDVAAGPPVIALGTGTVVQATLDDIAAVSGGSTLGVADATAAANAALAAIDAESHADYVVRYRAKPGAPKSRTVTVTINGKTVEVPYEVPDAPVVPAAIAGLYLTMQVGDRVATRAVAGLALSPSSANPTITEAMFADVRSLMRGRVSFAVEGAAPSPSIVLSDWIAERLSLKPLFTALDDKDDAKLLEALKDGVVVTPGTLPVAQTPLPDAWSEDSLTFETGPRITSLVQKVHLGGPVTRALDVWPLSRWSTAATNARTAFERTLEATSSLAVTEAGLLGARSTLKSLKGVDLTLVEAGLARDQADLTDEQQRAWTLLEAPFVGRYLLLVPHDPGAFWAIEKNTGTVIGVLPDGSGGSMGDSCDAFNDANTMISALGLIGSLAGASVGGWAALARWEVKYITVADIVIGGGSIPPGEGDLSNPAGDMGCGMADDAIGNAIPAVGAYEAVVDTLDNIGADTGAPTVCGGGGSLCQ